MKCIDKGNYVGAGGGDVAVAGAALLPGPGGSGAAHPVAAGIVNHLTVALAVGGAGDALVDVAVIRLGGAIGNSVEGSGRRGTNKQRCNHLDEIYCGACLLIWFLCLAYGRV